MEDVLKIFAERLSGEIKSAGITQKVLSLATEIPESTISDWINMKKMAKIDGLLKLANYFNVTTDYLLGREV